MNNSYSKDKWPAEDERASFELQIEELVLHGFDPGDRHRISEAIEKEMTRLIAERGLSDRLTDGIHIPRLDGASFQINQGSKPETAGVQIARSVHGSLSGKR